MQTLIILGLLLTVACQPKAKKEAPKMMETTEVKPQEPVYDTNKPESILKAIAHTHGGWNDLWKKHDVEYTYHYEYPENGNADISIERYIFGTEESFAKYTQHQINVMPNAEGEITQFFDGKSTIIMKHDGNEVNDEKNLNMADFLRKTNYYWFTMPYKLGDKAATAKYLGTEEHDGKVYDKVEVSYNAEMTGKAQNDVYIVLVNPETKLVDRFYFSLPFFGIEEPVILAHYEYENVDGQLISTKRSYYIPSEEGYGEQPSIVQTMSNVKFNNGFTPETLTQ
ncbi:DUF6503 family protein [Allomuricauda sp. AC10]|uniref:DUF6503 family protein n=1 Tax=Flavobacteriaceae TaxID=49546 RepID=UPI00234BDB69|nr:DUF6503 family protein [Muricauda sp. AC10]